VLKIPAFAKRQNVSGHCGRPPRQQTNKQEMKHIRLTTLIFGILLFGCNQADIKKSAAAEEKLSTSIDDKAQIQKLIQQVLKWSDSKNTIDVLPYSIDSKDSTCNGFDIDKLKSNLQELRRIEYFAEEFIQNYKQIIQTLDIKIKNNEFEKWHPYGELPTFPFANDVNPWCECQDNREWDLVEVKVISLTADKGELDWFWGNLDQDTNESWKEFNSFFRVVKENGKWKIAYMHGFDFKKSTQ
jgi:hypothetical protein